MFNMEGLTGSLITNSVKIELLVETSRREQYDSTSLFSIVATTHVH